MRQRGLAFLGMGFLLGAVACASSGSTTSDAGGVIPGSGGDASVDATLDGTAAPGSEDAGSGDAAPDAETSDAASPTYAVGVTTRTWVDTTRITPANGTQPQSSSRTLLTEIWYPTPGAPSAAAPARDVPLAPGGPYPLVLFVHGSSSGRLFYTYLTIALASAGYVVAAADFPLTALSTPGGSSDLHVSDEVGDLSFLCDEAKGGGLDAGDLLTGAVDGLHYAVVGHSTGGAVAELAAFAGTDSAITHDPRVTTAVPLSGDACMFDSSFFKSRSVPILAIGATNDLFVRLPNSGQWVFDNTGEPHVLLKILGGEHMFFTDLNLPDALLGPVPTGPTSPLATTLQAYGDAGACLPEPEAGTDPAITFDAQHAIVIQWVTAWLDAQMKQHPAALGVLETSNDPAVVVQQ